MALVVIVDDQAINLKILSRFARAVSADVAVYTFESPLEALDLIARKPPDLIVTDIVMPTMSGEDFIVRCRQLPNARDVPIIAVTAYEDREYRYRALNAGASDFLLSPFDGREFCTRARNLLALRQYQMSLKSRATLLESRTRGERPPACGGCAATRRTSAPRRQYRTGAHSNHRHRRQRPFRQQLS